MLETLKKHQLLATLKKCEFAQQSLVYVTGGGELKIDLAKMDTILKWPIPTNVIEVRIFVGVARYLRKFIASFLAKAQPLHAIPTSGKSF